MASIACSTQATQFLLTRSPFSPPIRVSPSNFVQLKTRFSVTSGAEFFPVPENRHSTASFRGSGKSFGLFGGSQSLRRKSSDDFWVTKAAADDADGLSKPSKSFAEKFPVLVTGFFFFTWYFLNVIFNILNKKVYNYFPYPYFVSVVHLLVGVVYCLFSWAFGLPNRVPIDKEQLALLTPVAFYHGLGHVMSNVSFAAVAVSHPHTSSGKAAGNRRSIETFTRSKKAWNGSVAEPENRTGGPSWSKPPLLNNRVQSAEMTVRKDCSGNKPFSGKQGFGSWNKNGMGNYEDHKFQQKG